jgi:hypothetical protein
LARTVGEAGEVRTDSRRQSAPLVRAV